MQPLEHTDEILERISAGESLNAICKTKGYPTEQSVRRRVVADPEFAAKYAGARSIGLDCIAESINEIAEDREDDPNSRRVRIDARKWFLSKLRPDKYGDAIKVEHSGQVDLAGEIRKRRQEREKE